MRVAVAMSGGVDSSVAAALMVEQGHEVVGLTMKLRDTTAEERAGRSASCCSPDDLMDARTVCDTLGVAHYVIDYRDAFRAAVIEPFARTYLAGLTPNPCVACNDHVKFAPLLERARALGADLLVTGHYARVEPDPAGGFALCKGADQAKDQSYFLFGLDQSALAQVRFPLGEMSKDAVRDHARRLGLSTWDKHDSEDICFVPDGDYARVVEQVAGPAHAPAPGAIVHQDGRALGTHGGVHRFTVGQRKGLGVATGERLFVLSVDGDARRVTVGPRAALSASGLRASRWRWVSGRPEAGPVHGQVRIRYRHAGVGATVLVDGAQARVVFDTPQAAIAPGQAVVLYAGDRVWGGGFIDGALCEASPDRAEAGRGRG